MYLVLAAYSLRYYATFANISEQSIDSFLLSIGSPLRGFYAEHSKHNLLTSDSNVSLSAYLKSESHKMSLVRRAYISVGVIIAIVISTLNFMRQTEIVWQIAQIILIIVHARTAFWAWRFGSKLAQIENSAH